MLSLTESFTKAEYLASCYIIGGQVTVVSEVL